MRPAYRRCVTARTGSTRKHNALIDVHQVRWSYGAAAVPVAAGRAARRLARWRRDVPHAVPPLAGLVTIVRSLAGLVTIVRSLAALEHFIFD